MVKIENVFFFLFMGCPQLSGLTYYIRSIFQDIAAAIFNF
jgi:hypothetical protein